MTAIALTNSLAIAKDTTVTYMFCSDAIADQFIFTFPNGYGASVIQGPYTYGGSQGLFEIAVLDRAGELDYSTPVTSDVVGFLDVPGVDKVLAEIAGLPAAPTVN